MIRLIYIRACAKRRKVIIFNLCGLNRLLFATKKPVAEELNLWLLTNILVDIKHFKLVNIIKSLEAENANLRQCLEKGQNSSAKWSHLTDDEKNSIKSLRQDNLSFGEIGRIVGRSSEAVRQVLKEAHK
jgi:prophage antirepressor-like protein